MLQVPLCGMLAYRQGGILRGYIGLAADGRSGQARVREEEALDAWCLISKVFTSTGSRDEYSAAKHPCILP